MIFDEQFTHFIFALTTAHIILKITTRGQEYANVGCLYLVGLDFLWENFLTEQLLFLLYRLRN